MMKACHDFGQIMVQPDIWGTFQAFELDFDMSGERYRFLFDEKKPRDGAGFRESCSFEFPLDRLSIW
jgi:hypothetical protein